MGLKESLRKRKRNPACLLFKKKKKKGGKLRVGGGERNTRAADRQFEKKKRGHCYIGLTGKKQGGEEKERSRYACSVVSGSREKSSRSTSGKEKEGTKRFRKGERQLALIWPTFANEEKKKIRASVLDGNLGEKEEGKGTKRLRVSGEGKQKKGNGAQTEHRVNWGVEKSGIYLYHVW